MAGKRSKALKRARKIINNKEITPMTNFIFPVTLFFVGVMEMLIVTAWTRAVGKTKVLESGIISWINVLIWYWVLQAVVNNINNWSIAIVYAFGCALGTMLTTYFYSVSERRSRKAKANRMNKVASPRMVASDVKP